MDFTKDGFGDWMYRNLKPYSAVTPANFEVDFPQSLRDNSPLGQFLSILFDSPVVVTDRQYELHGELHDLPEWAVVFQAAVKASGKLWLTGQECLKLLGYEPPLTVAPFEPFKTK